MCFSSPPPPSEYSPTQIQSVRGCSATASCRSCSSGAVMIPYVHQTTYTCVAPPSSMRHVTLQCHREEERVESKVKLREKKNDANIIVRFIYQAHGDRGLFSCFLNEAVATTHI